MKKFENIFNCIPDYKVFLTVDEMDESSKRLAQQYPDIVELFIAGESRNGHPLYCLKIGSGKENALLYGCPHPNEPIGAMMLEYMAEALASDDDFRAVLDYTFYIIKSVDPDGTKLNEGWFKGPFTLLNYAKEFYRPESSAQTDWTFPIKYKNLDFNAPIPEAQALMKIIDEKRPKFIYPLHNAGIGGTYWYLNHDIKEIHEDLLKSTESVNIPANFGEAEMPYIIEFAPAIYKMVGVKQMYDHTEKHAPAGTNPADMIAGGTSSAEYAEAFYNPLSVITELPYFVDERISDLTNTDSTRKEEAMKGFEYQSETIAFIKENLKDIEEYLDEKDNPFYNSIKMYMRVPSYNETSKSMMMKDKNFDELASVADRFDVTVKSKFYIGILPLGILYRLSKIELDKMENGDTIDQEKHVKFVEAKETAYSRMKQVADELDAELDIRVIPIRDMIKVQLETGLIILDYISDKEINDL